MKPINVLICDDSMLIRRLLTRMLEDVSDIRVIGTACDPYDAREKIKQLNPDVLTLDIEMPKMDGLSFLEKIMTLRPMPVVMVSTLTQKGAYSTLRALEIGAVDYIAKPSGEDVDQRLPELKEQLLEKIRMAAKANVTPMVKKTEASVATLEYKPLSHAPRLIAIGSSTGGVEALRQVLQAFPANTPPIVSVQHMPAAFTRSFAERLNGLCTIDVQEAKDGTLLEPGHAYIAPGDKQMRVIAAPGGKWKCQVKEGEKVSGHCPSVDVLFDSVAEAAGKNAVGIILTGMGKDGAQGMKKMRDHGAHTIGQNKNSCVVYGMPGAAMAAGAVATELPLSAIADGALEACAKKEVSS